MPRAFVVSEVRTLTKVVAAFAVVLLALGLWGSPAWAQVTSLEKTGPDEVLAGEDFTYAIALRTATNPATDVEIVDELPSGVDLNGTLPPGCTSDEQSNRFMVTCDLGEVAANTTETITLNVEAPENTGTITNTARVSSNTADPRRGNNVDSVRTTVEADTEPTDEETTDEETTAEETTDEETTDEETTAEETTNEETSVVDGQTVIIPDELSDKPLPNTGGPGGIALATGCALLGVGLIVNRIIR